MRAAQVWCLLLLLPAALLAGCQGRGGDGAGPEGPGRLSLVLSHGEDGQLLATVVANRTGEPYRAEQERYTVEVRPVGNASAEPVASRQVTLWNREYRLVGGSECVLRRDLVVWDPLRDHRAGDPADGLYDVQVVADLQMDQWSEPVTLRGNVTARVENGVPQPEPGGGAAADASDCRSAPFAEPTVGRTRLVWVDSSFTLVGNITRTTIPVGRVGDPCTQASIDPELGTLNATVHAPHPDEVPPWMVVQAYDRDSLALSFIHQGSGTGIASFDAGGWTIIVPQTFGPADALFELKAEGKDVRAGGLLLDAGASTTLDFDYEFLSGGETFRVHERFVVSNEGRVTAGLGGSRAYCS